MEVIKTIEYINNIKHIVKHFKNDTQDLKMFFVDDKIHRENDLPAVIDYKRNIHTWYNKGKIHRNNDLPAQILFDKKEKEWYENGKIHRGNGLPAIISENEEDSFEIYCINDKEVDKEVAIKFSIKNKLKDF